MDKRGGTLLAVVIALSLLLNPRASRPGSGGTSPTPPPGGGRTAQTPAKGSAEADEQRKQVYKFDPHVFDPRGFLPKIIGEYYGNGAPIPPLEKMPAWGIERGQQANIRFLIATVPDPVRSHLSLFFDRHVDAIQQAVQESGYSFARAIMPWESVQHVESSDYETRLAQDRYQREKEKLPGLMIFRKATSEEANSSAQATCGSEGSTSGCSPEATENDKPPSQEALFVFVVGETPTGGIHKLQFKNALEIARKIRDATAANKQEKPALDILGPTFSGSLPSLNDLLWKIRDGYGAITVRSGTVTGYEPVKSFLKTKPVGVRFSTFQESDTYGECHFFAYARQQNYRLDEIVILSEDETAFGRFEKRNETEACGPILNPPPTDNDQGAVHLYFPREIAQLRAAYQRDLQTGQIPDPTGKRQAQQTLPLNLEDSGADEDGVPTYGHAQYPLSQESVMLGITTSLRAHHTRFVVLKATDPLDLLFLARYLRQSYPQGRIVTIGADLLFRREVEDDLLHGIMAITTYSLLPGADDGVTRPAITDHRGHSERVFPSTGSAGAYNAVLSLLAEGTPVPCQDSSTSGSAHAGGCEIAADLRPARYTEYGWPQMGFPPPDDRRWLTPTLWLTVLGRDAYWPMALLDTFPKKPTPNKNWSPDVDQNSGVKEGSSSDQTTPTSRLHAIRTEPNKPKRSSNGIYEFYRHAPQEWIVLCCAVCAFALVFLFLAWGGTLLSTSESGVNFAPVPNKSRSCVLLFAGLMIEVMFLLLLWPWQRWLQHLQPWPWGAGILLVFIVFLVGFLCDLKRRRIAQAFYLFVVISLGMILVARWVGEWGPDIYDNLTVFRYVHLTSGVSPLPALLFLVLAGLWWAWYTLRGLTFLDSRRPQLPSADQLNQMGQFAMTENGNRTLLRVMHPVTPDFRILLPAILVGVIFFLVSDWVHFRWAHPVQTLEGSMFDRCFAAAAWAVMFVLLTTLARLNVTWLEFRRLLLALDRSPLRRGLSQLLGFSWKPIWSLSGGSFQDSYRFSSRETEALFHIQRTGTGGQDDVIGEETTLQEKLKAFIPLLPKIYKESNGACERYHHEIELRGVDFNKKLADAMRDFQLGLAHACGVVIASLQKVWDAERDPSLFDLPEANADTKDGKKKGSRVPANTQLREKFVSLVYANFMVTVLLRMHSLIVTVAGMYIFLLLSFSVYPFEPKQAIQPLLILLFFVIVAVVGTIYAQMHRDATLSRLTKTNPGELGVDFWIRIGSFVILPLIGLLASQFPDINNFLFSWLTPATQALNH